MSAEHHEADGLPNGGSAWEVPEGERIPNPGNVGLVADALANESQQAADSLQGYLGPLLTDHMQEVEPGLFARRSGTPAHPGLTDGLVIFVARISPSAANRLTKILYQKGKP